MISSRPAIYWLACSMVGPWLVFSAAAETAPPTPLSFISPSANLIPPTPPAISPVESFRRLLAMSVPEREAFLTNKPTSYRVRLLAKVHEYQALGPDERELRLRATELRWCLLPFFHEPATNHAARLALVPEDLRALVKSRVDEWDILPPTLQQEFLANERALHFFTHVDTTNSPPLPPGISPHNGPNDEEQSRWNALSTDERQKITTQFNHFFELTPVEKQKTLNTLSAAERAQMEKTLQSFSQLPAAKRSQCIRAYAQFASMSPQSRSEFLKNAEQWSQMSPNDRQTWRDLVTHVPLWPPMPQSILPPPMPPRISPRVPPVVATNHN